MSRYIAAGSDFHGNTSLLGSAMSSVPAGTHVYLLGDNYGPSDRSYPNSLKQQYGNTRLYDGLYAESKKNPDEHRKFLENINTSTKSTIDTIIENSARN